MSYRVSPFWWPVMAVASPVAAPWLFMKTVRFRKGQAVVEKENQRRLRNAEKLELPVLKKFSLTPVVEQQTVEGFLGDPGVSYLIRTDRGGVLFDIGFGTSRPSFLHNASRLGVNMKDADALVISHLHPDHMGGTNAFRNRTISMALADEFLTDEKKPCYVPDGASAVGFETSLVTEPKLIEAGLATTGPLARMLYFLGLTEEQVLLANLEGKGLVIVTGCGHPTIELILRMVRRLSDLPIYAIAGGLHFPINASRDRRMGIETQQVFGTGKTWWETITPDELTNTILAINEADPKVLLLSAHDSCDYSLQRLADETEADTRILKAGETVTL